MRTSAITVEQLQALAKLCRYKQKKSSRNTNRYRKRYIKQNGQIQEESNIEPNGQKQGGI